MELKHIQHLYWRAGFGITASELNAIKGLSKKPLIERLVDNSERYGFIDPDWE